MTEKDLLIQDLRRENAELRARAPKWTSVNDRLPSREGLMYDESEYVLVWESFDDVPGLEGEGCASICGYRVNGWDETDNFGGVRPDRITHWMLLPDAPKEEGE